MPPKSATEHLKEIDELAKAKDEQTLKTKYHTSISHCKSIDSDIERANKTFHKTHVKSGEEKAKNCPVCNPNWREESLSKNKCKKVEQKSTNVEVKEEQEQKTKKEIKGTILEEF